MHESLPDTVVVSTQMEYTASFVSVFNRIPVDKRTSFITLKDTCRIKGKSRAFYLLGEDNFKYIWQTYWAIK